MHDLCVYSSVEAQPAGLEASEMQLGVAPHAFF